MGSYSCRHCTANLDKGDILEHFKSTCHDDPIKAASSYGWSDTNKIHFSRSITVQPESGAQYTVCPECKTRDPFKQDGDRPNGPP